MKPYKPYAPYSDADFRKFVTRLVLFGVLIIAVFAGLCYFIDATGNRPIKGAVTDEAEKAALDIEFEQFVGEGHNLRGCSYIKTATSNRLDLGFGPLYTAHDYQFIVGKTGAVAAIGYGTVKGKNLNLSPNPEVGSQIYILYFDGYVAPREWWNHAAFSTTVHGVLMDDGQFLPEVFIILPWPDWMDFDNPPLIDTVEAPAWYWDGSAYVGPDSTDSSDPSSHALSSQTQFHGAPSGALLLAKDHTNNAKPPPNASTHCKNHSSALAKSPEKHKRY